MAGITLNGGSLSIKNCTFEYVGVGLKFPHVRNGIKEKPRNMHFSAEEVVPGLLRTKNLEYVGKKAVSILSSLFEKVVAGVSVSLIIEYIRKNLF